MAGPIVIGIKGDNTDAVSKLNQTASVTDRLGNAARRMVVPLGLATAAVGTLAAQSVSAASDLSESVSKNEQVFGRQAKAIERFSARADTALGQSQVSALDALATFGLIGEKAGLGDRETAKFSKTFTTLASDLASFNNTSPEEAIEAISAAMRGESEPIRKYGVLLDDATLRARALKMGLVETTKDALTPQNKALAASQEILAQTTKAQGDFARTSGGMANQSRAFTAQLENLKAGFGQALLPAMTEVVTYGNQKVVPFLADLADDYAPKIADALADVPGILDRLGSVDVGDGSEYGEIAANLAKVGPGAKDLLATLPSLNDTLSVTSEVVGFAAENSNLLGKALPFLAAGYVAVKGAQAAANAAALIAVPTKFAEIAANRQLAASNRALLASRTELTGAVITGTRADQASAAATTATTGKLSGLAGAAKIAAGAAGLGLLIDSTTRADGAVATLESTLGGAATGFAVGGPIGGAVGGLSGLLVGLSRDMDDAAASGRAAYRELAKVDPVEEATASMADLIDTLDQVTGAYTGATRAAALKRLEDAGLVDVAAKYGISAREVVNAALGQQGAMKNLGPVVRNVKDQISDLDQAQKDLARNPQNFDTEGFTADAQAQYVALEKQKKALQGNLAELQKMPGQLRAMGKEVRENTAATTEYAGKLKGLPPEVKTDVKTNGIEPSARAIVDLARKYDLTPKQVKTLIEASGADTSAAAVQRLKDRIDALRDKSVTVTTTYRTLGNGPTPNKPLQVPGGEAPRISGRAVATDYLLGIREGFKQGSEGINTALETLNTRIERKVDEDLKAQLKTVDTRYDQIAASMRKRLDGKALQNALKRNAEDREKAENKATTASERSLRQLMRSTKDLRAQLVANGLAQDTANQKFKEASDLLQTMRDQATGYAASIRDAVAASGSLTSLGQGLGFGTVEQLIENRAAAVADAEEFVTLIQQLSDAGLNAVDLQDLISQGVKEGIGTARALVAGGPGVLNAINTLSSKLQTAGQTLGDRLADKFYGAGITAQASLVTGLQSDSEAAIRAGEALGAQIGSAVAQGFQNATKDVWHVAGGGTPATNAYTAQTVAAAPRETVQVRFSAEQLDALSRGRQVQADLDAFHAVGGRSRA